MEEEEEEGEVIPENPAVAEEEEEEELPAVTSKYMSNLPMEVDLIQDVDKVEAALSKGISIPAEEVEDDPVPPPVHSKKKKTHPSSLDSSTHPLKASKLISTPSAEPSKLSSHTTKWSQDELSDSDQEEEVDTKLAPATHVIKAATPRGTSKHTNIKLNKGHLEEDSSTEDPAIDERPTKLYVSHRGVDKKDFKVLAEDADIILENIVKKKSAKKPSKLEVEEEELEKDSEDEDLKNSKVGAKNGGSEGSVIVSKRIDSVDEEEVAEAEMRAESKINEINGNFLNSEKKDEVLVAGIEEEEEQQEEVEREDEMDAEESDMTAKGAGSNSHRMRVNKTKTKRLEKEVLQEDGLMPIEKVKAAWRKKIRKIGPPQDLPKEEDEEEEEEEDGIENGDEEEGVETGSEVSKSRLNENTKKALKRNSIDEDQKLNMKEKLGVEEEGEEDEGTKLVAKEKRRQAALARKEEKKARTLIMREYDLGSRDLPPIPFQVIKHGMNTKQVPLGR
eukprot:CAMPEP_0196598794 /NCGR_PEP_ID=MMETSP1081-20130531/94512_1 /TAXON_ID=36882 /ORGANISM="Pyramimonas amylifera, Strain CCMP720" /LENGTH=503 /DNA_ID=CAMNT_0041924517 /DNA_START=12 /DNA_END=1523 /DNA_ORIENTATION=+